MVSPGLALVFEGLRVCNGQLGQIHKLPPMKKNRAIGIKSSVIMSNGKPEPEVVQRMMNEGMFTLTGKKTVADEWRKFLTPDDNVGIKINPIGGVKFSNSLKLSMQSSVD